MIRKFWVEYQTPSHIPPPYSHTYKLSAHADGKQLQISYDITYTEREELTEEELEDEGFSPNDDLSISAQVNLVWWTSVQNLLQHTKLQSAPEATHEDDEHSPLLVGWETADGTQHKGFPINNSDWQYLAQELTQATLEAAQHESPLSIRFLKIASATHQTEVEISVGFADRDAQVSVVSDDKQKTYPLAWEKIKPLLQAIYAPEYYPEKALADQPEKAGSYIDCGDGLWYKLGDGVRNMPGQKLLPTLEKQFTEWL